MGQPERDSQNGTARMGRPEWEVEYVQVTHLYVLYKKQGNKEARKRDKPIDE